MKYRLVIFDMDGTLTEERLDFAAIRRDLGMPPEGGILERLNTLAGEEQVRAKAILERHEMAAAEVCRIHEGAVALLEALRKEGVTTALLTRNSAACARRILGRHQLVLDHTATREDLPHKPHPDSILNITRKLGMPLGETLMVGDYLYDLQAAHAAGVDAALVRADIGENPPEFAMLATYRVSRLLELLAIVRGE